MQTTEHPGIILKARLAATGLSGKQLATRIKVPANRINGIIRGNRRITADTALRLARIFGTSADYWMDLQKEHDLYLANESKGEEIDALINPL